MCIDPLNRQRETRWIAVVLLVQTALTLTINWNAAPSADEPAHLAAGLYHWQTGRFDAYRVNPPLVRLGCTLPLLGSSQPQFTPPIWPFTESRLEWSLDDRLLEHWSFDELTQRIRWARVVNLAPAIWSSIVVWRWTRRLAGATAARWALLFWAWCPNQLAWSASLCPDLPASAMALTAVYVLHDKPVHNRAGRDALTWIARCGVWTGLAMLCKSTYASLPVLYLLTGVTCLSRQHLVSQLARGLMAWCGIATVAILVVDLGYAGEGVGTTLSELPFRSRSCLQVVTWLSSYTYAARVVNVPLPLPANFLLGIDTQLREFDRGGASYLCGEWRERGWWHYYLVGGLFKIPCLILLLFVSNLWQIVQRRDGAAMRQLVLPGMTFLAIVSCQTGFSQHWRYAFGALPYVHMLAGIRFAACRQGFTRTAWRLLGFVSLAYALSYWPRDYAYFNEVSLVLYGRVPPLVDTNLDWGQDLSYAQRWLLAQTTNEPIFHAVVTDDLAAALSKRWNAADRFDRPGWYVVSWQRLHHPADAAYVLHAVPPTVRLTSSLSIFHRERLGQH